MNDRGCWTRGFWPALMALTVSAMVAAAPTPGWAETWDELVKAAEKDGAITIAGGVVKAHRETVALFQKAFPKIKLEFTGVTPDTFEPRVRAERKANLYLWDVHTGGVSSLIYTRQIPDGWYDPVREVIRPEIAKDALWLGGYDAGFLDKDKKFVFAFTGEISESVFVHRGMIKESELKTLDDMLKPQFKGMTAWLNPQERNAGSTAYARIMVVLGEDKARLLLTEQQPVISRTPRQLAEWAVRGRYPITVGTNRSDMAEFHEQGIGKEVAVLADSRGQSITPGTGGLLLMNRAPHPAAARLFVNWLLDKEAQTDWAARAKRNSRRTDVPKGDPSTAPTAKEWLEGLNLNAESSTAVRIRSMDIAREALNK